MTLQAAVQAAFSPDGLLARVLPGFRSRPGQTEMAQAVAHTIETGGVLVVEAGTGVGKTLAYVVPALLGGEKVLISTATKALQDQLYLRDIPRLLAAFGFPVRVALLKGRASYLCSQRLQGARHTTQALDVSDLRLLARVEDWAVSTVSGDIAEVSELDERSVIIPLVTSTRDNCLGSACPQIRHCHINLARQEAMKAELVVVNHHLFFADLGVRASGVAELLPSVTTVVFDEAHQLNDIGVHFFARQWSTGQVLSLGRDLAALAQGPARGLADWQGLQADAVQSAQAFKDLFAVHGPQLPRPWIEPTPQGVTIAQWQAAVAHCARSLRAASAALRAMEELGPDFTALAERCDNLLQTLEIFSDAAPQGEVRWLEVGAHVQLSQSPLTIASPMRALARPDAAPGSQPKSWIFTSATLGTDAQLSWFVDSCGMNGAQVLRVPSPFDYASQGAVYVPPHFPKPQDANHSTAVAALVAQGARALGGRTMVLTTTMRAMRAIADSLRQQFRAEGLTLDVLLQGQAPKRELVERFLSASAVAAPAGCVLVATASFWEGIDIAGDALQLLVIDKLPFAPPDDPLVQARASAQTEAGGNAFKSVHLPQAAIALKQGAGRLIRSETDRGILVVCDVRLAHMGYGKQLLAALPPMRRLTGEAQWLAALAKLQAPMTK
ncbi:MAG: ATP-dependent DNA helicase [Rhodoferax sp.]|nr:ATP-dependent DNA helicase [Rhodoferax sp.]